jgi:hypothetical protein
MGSSTDQIEREIEQTRERIDENLSVLEGRAASSAVRYGRIAGIALGVAAAGVVGFLIYRRMKRPTIKDRLESLSPESLRDLMVELGARVKKEAPSVTVTLNDKTEPEPGLLETILRKVGPALVGTASTAVIEKVTQPSGHRDARPVVRAYE